MKMQKQIKLIEQWAIDRGLDKNGTVEGQFFKTAEEVAELIIGISKGNLKLIKDSVGDVFVTLVVGCLIEGEDIDWDKKYRLAMETSFKYNLDKSTMIYDLVNSLNYLNEYDYAWMALPLTITLKFICDFYNLELIDCIGSAYKEIAGRKGRVIDGTFVKESDLNE